MPRGRPPKPASERRDRRLELTFTAPAFDRLTFMADHRGQTLKDFIRTAVTRHVEEASRGCRHRPGDSCGRCGLNPQQKEPT